MEIEQRIALKALLNGLDEVLIKEVGIFVGFTRATKNKYGLPSGILYHKNRRVFAVRVNTLAYGCVYVGTYADDALAVSAWKTAKIAILKSLRVHHPEMPDSLYDLLKGLVESVEV